jgi:hypothetical protein
MFLKRETWPRPAKIDLIWARFWPLVDIRGPNECWPWLGGKSGEYGWFCFPGIGQVPAHRMALALSQGGPLWKRSCGCHTCDNPPCANPLHLFEGTHKQNSEDASRKGRFPTKITPDDVRTLRAMADRKDRAAFAAVLGITTHHAHQIFRRKERWLVPDA